MVQRYSMGLKGAERLLTMVNIQSGEYVLYSDYAKLEEALLECLGELASRLPTDKFVYRRLAEKHAKEVEDTVTLERLDALKRFQLLRRKAREVLGNGPS